MRTRSFKRELNFVNSDVPSEYHDLPSTLHPSGRSQIMRWMRTLFDHAHQFSPAARSPVGGVVQADLADFVDPS
jgi:hypothetical protein